MQLEKILSNQNHLVWSFSRKNLILNAYFVLLYLLSGILFLSPIPYRMGPVSILFGALLPFFFRLKITSVFLVYIAICIVVFLSGLINQSSMIQVLYFLRIPTFAFLSYYIVLICSTLENIDRIIYWGRIVGIIQLPIILIQETTYQFWPASVKNIVSELDSSFGTFYVKTDYAIGIFLILHIIILLFSKNRFNLKKQHRIILIILYSATIFVTNAEFTKICLILTLLIFFFTRIPIMSLMLPILGVILSIAIVLGAIDLLNTSYYTGGSSSNLIASATRRVQTIIEKVQSDEISYDDYLNGRYDRVAAIRYLFIENPSFFGEGPAKFDPEYGSERRGNTGHTLMMTAEIGFVGMGLTLLMFVAIAMPIWSEEMLPSERLSIMAALGTLFLCGFVYPIMNDVAVVFSYSVFIAYIKFQSSQPASMLAPNFIRA